MILFYDCPVGLVKEVNCNALSTLHIYTVCHNSLSLDPNFKCDVTYTQMSTTLV